MSNESKYLGQREQFFQRLLFHKKELKICAFSFLDSTRIRQVCLPFKEYHYIIHNDPGTRR